MGEKHYCVYILTNFRKTVLYIGFTGNLAQRMEQHKTFEVEGFTKKYKTDRLIYFEAFEDVYEARTREKALKKWKRAWKEELIARVNPNWEDVLIV